MKSPSGRITQWPAVSSSSRPKTEGPSKRAGHHQFTVPARSTRAALRPSARNPCSLISGRSHGRAYPARSGGMPAPARSASPGPGGLPPDGGGNATGRRRRMLMTRPSNPTAAWQPGMPGGDNLPSGPAGRPAPPSGDGHGPQAGPPTVTIGSYPDYPSAQRVVDYLADNRFPVERTAIVGHRPHPGRNGDGPNDHRPGRPGGRRHRRLVRALHRVALRHLHRRQLGGGDPGGAGDRRDLGRRLRRGGARHERGAARLHLGQFTAGRPVRGDRGRRVADQARQLLGRMHLAPMGATAR